MEAKRWQRVKELFQTTLARAPQENVGPSSRKPARARMACVKKSSC